MIRLGDTPVFFSMLVLYAICISSARCFSGDSKENMSLTMFWFFCKQETANLDHILQVFNDVLIACLHTS